MSQALDQEEDQPQHDDPVRDRIAERSAFVPEPEFENQKPTQEGMDQACEPCGYCQGLQDALCLQECDLALHDPIGKNAGNQPLSIGSCVC
nr:hypothetical protein Iba_chr09bCG13510 [Ipomoea batatas]GMD36225.1 hypothetical protein Iba_chr09dCG14420 [Ipomoea batatas]